MAATSALVFLQLGLISASDAPSAVDRILKPVASPPSGLHEALQRFLCIPKYCLRRMDSCVLYASLSIRGKGFPIMGYSIPIRPRARPISTRISVPSQLTPHAYYFSCIPSTSGAGRYYHCLHVHSNSEAASPRLSTVGGLLGWGWSVLR
ncbi:hypothetical protein DFH07DRAFT_74288 [Mycena maculata]|uniref:Secreted protein n=1 Tax=Mycena maculata TaxID=230809 RepID=A0AAD7K106_9AGAR|nr:hypothetical protein DFH07DRAFT_74288 [Mycena maculata]